MLLAFGATFALCTSFGADSAPAILAAALTVGLMRRAHEPSAGELFKEVLTLPLVALAAAGIGHVFLTVPVAGAALFCAAIALSIWLRQFGDVARAIGRTIALPLLAMLIVPVRISGPGATPALLLVAAGLVALLSTALVSWCVARFAEHAKTETPPPQKRARAPSTARPTIATRMALQMLAALVLAFAIGLIAFPAHWPWIVLTAFIVCSGALGRGDALYKGLLRLGGAIGGTLVAALAAHVTFPNGIAYAVTLFAALFAGIWLRALNYAFWAACMTLIFALLQGSQGANVTSLFGLRVFCILIGALCAVAATWFVYPIRTEQIVRRRVADALATLREILTGAHGDGAAKHALVDFHAAELERLAPPVRLHRRVFGAKNAGAHPATLIERMHALLHRVRETDFDRAQVGAEMRHVGALLRGEQTNDGTPAAASKPPVT